MNPQIKIESPSLAAAVQSFRKLPAEMLEAIRAEMDAQNLETVGHIQQYRLQPFASRPYPPQQGRLRNPNGHLLRSLRASEAVVVGGAIESAIGTNIEYAGVHEFGFVGTVQIAAHRRQRAPRGKAPTTSTFDFASGKITKKKKRSKGNVSGSIEVRAHSRRMNIPVRAPIRRGVEDRATQYANALAAAVLKV